MRDGQRNPWWDPMGVWQQVAEPFTNLSPESAPFMWAGRNPLQALLHGLRAGLIGRSVAVGSGPSRVAFTLSSLEASVGHLAAAAAQADDVSLSAANVEWRTYQFVTVSARLHNVHTRFRAKPVLVSAPLDVSVVMTGARLTSLLAEFVPSLSIVMADEARMLVRHARHPRWGHVEVLPAVDHGGLVLRPTGIGRGARMWRFGRRIVAVRPSVSLPEGVRFVGVDAHPDGLQVLLRVDELTVGLSELASLARKSR